MAKQSMMQAITQAAIEALKAAIMAARGVETFLKMQGQHSKQ